MEVRRASFMVSLRDGPVVLVRMWYLTDVVYNSIRYQNFKCMKQTSIAIKVAHRYHAIKQEGFLNRPQVDMEEFEACLE